MTVVTRIAPSPTGDPHVGTAYIGLFNYALAKQAGGKFIFRLEDTDQERLLAGTEQRLQDMFTWLGIEPDESPFVGGPNGPYRQSNRLDMYQEYAEQLVKEGKAYRAFETAEELEQMRTEQRQLGRPLGYDGRGREVPAEEQERRAAAGEEHVIRFRTPDDGETIIRDRLRGDIAIPNSEVRDAVLLKSDGFPTYHLAVVVDDHHMGVTHIIRAEEWISSAPLHKLLYEAFGWEAPEFIHMPLLRNPDKSKVSKRKLDTSVDSYREQGILPEALLNFLGNMGWSMPDGQEFFTLDEMIANFDIDRVSLGGPVFDLKKLKHFNNYWLRSGLSLEEVARRAAPSLEAHGYVWDDEDYLLDVIDVLRPRAETIEEIADQAGYFFTETVRYNQDARRQLEAGQSYLQDLEREFSRLEYFDYDDVDDVLHSYVQDQAVPMGRVLMPMRAALTGTTNAPSVTDIVAIFGRELTLQRLAQALTFIDAGLPDDDPQRAIEEEKARLAALEKSGRKSPVPGKQA